MNKSGLFDLLWADLVREAAEDRIDEALSILRQLESSHRLSIDELVFKGQLIQQAESAPGYELEDAKRALQIALDRDGKYPPALIEMGHYCWVMDDDAEAGLDYFNKAIEAAKELLSEAQEGKEKCLSEIADRNQQRNSDDQP